MIKKVIDNCIFCVRWLCVYVLVSMLIVVLLVGCAPRLNGKKSASDPNLSQTFSNDTNAEFGGSQTRSLSSFSIHSGGGVAFGDGLVVVATLGEPLSRQDLNPIFSVVPQATSTRSFLLGASAPIATESNFVFGSLQDYQNAIVSP